MNPPSSLEQALPTPVDGSEQESVQFRLNRASVIDGISRRAVHDLRNSLQAITMASETLRDDLQDEDGPELIALIADAAAAADDTLRCVGPAPFRVGTDPAPLVLGQTVDWVVNALTPRRVPDGIEITADLPALPPVLAVEGPLRHALVNVVLNAREALAGREAGAISLAAESDGKTVTVTVGDDGPGIGPEIVDRIFEPFVTTKAGPEHFGLGLPVAARLVRVWGGSLELIRSGPGVGCCFALRLAAAGRVGPVAGR